MKYKVNNAMQFTWEGDADSSGSTQFVGKTYADSGRSFELEGPELLRALRVAFEPRSREAIVDQLSAELQLDASDADRLFETLVEGEFLLPADHENFTDGREWFDKDWRRALYYHLGTRDIDFADKGDGGTNAVIESYDQPPDVYPSFPSDELVELPDPERELDQPLNETMLRRRTYRRFRGEPIDARKLSSLLYHTFEPVRQMRDRLRERGEEDPSLQITLSHYLMFEVYPVVMRGDDVEPGVYQYSIADHALYPIDRDRFETAEDADQLVSDVAVGQQAVEGASLACYFTGHFERYSWRYRHSKALRTMFREIPAHAHRLILVATALGDRTFLTPALRDSRIDDAIDVDGYEESVLYFVCVGE